MSSSLFAAYPELEGKIPWTQLGELPTRVHKLERLGADVGARELWVKREDECGRLYGGNKVRKLEHLLADARDHHATRLVTLGGIGSNFAVAAALYGREAGIEVVAHAVPHEMDEHGRQNLRAVLGAGAQVRLGTRRESTARVLADYAKALAVRNGGPSYHTMLGGSSPLGTLGYVGAAFELKEQIARGELPEPEIVIVPLGSGGTLAGLTLGAKLAGLKARVVGVRVVERTLANASLTALLATGTARLMSRAGARLPRTLVRPSEISVLHGFFGGAYAHASPPAKDAVRRMHELEGIELETTYTGKALAGLLELIRSEQLYRKPILFINTVSSADLSAFVAKAPRREDAPAELRPYLD